MADSRGGKSIAVRSSDVRHSLLNLLDKARTAEVPLWFRKVEDVLDRYKLWTGNLGALHQAHKRMSLESRLADSPEVKDQICEQLDDMQEAVQDLIALLSGSRLEIETRTEHAEDTGCASPPEADDIRDTECISIEVQADSMLCMVSECLRALFRIGILVRKATPRDRFERALQQSEYAFSAQFDINYVKERYPKLASKDFAWLASRLGDGNSKRRQFINYVRDHRTNLEVEDTNAVEDANTMRQSSKATTFAVPGNLSTAEFLQSSVDDEDEDDSMSLVSASTAFENEHSLRLPSLADLSPDGEHFECPICFVLQTFRREKAWKLHAYRDLKAYVCTSVGKECEHKMFGDRDSWFDHELKHHHSLYMCKLCGYQYAGADLLERHVIDEHGSYSNEEIQSVIQHGRLVPSQLRATDCPFCDKWASILSQRRHRTDDRPSPCIEQTDILVSLTHFKRHVATHQEQLAIFAVPRMTDSDNERSPVAGDTNSAFSSNDENSQPPYLDKVGPVEAMDEDLKATVTAMCERLLASPPSDPQVWNDQYNRIIAMYSKNVQQIDDAYKGSGVHDSLGGGVNFFELSTAFLDKCPPFVALKRRHDELQARDNNEGDTHHLIGGRWRVKTYKFMDAGWKDQGTGFCAGNLINIKAGEKGARITIESEMEPGRFIIEESVHEDDYFQQSGEDMIVWSNHETDIAMAISFQKPAGRNAIWNIIGMVQRSAKKELGTPVTEGEMLLSLQGNITPDILTTVTSMQRTDREQGDLLDRAPVKEDLDRALGKDGWNWAKTLPGQDRQQIQLERDLTQGQKRELHERMDVHYGTGLGTENSVMRGTSSKTSSAQDTTEFKPEREAKAEPSEPAELFPEPVIREEQYRQPASSGNSTQSIEAEGLVKEDLEDGDLTTGMTLNITENITHEESLDDKRGHQHEIAGETGAAGNRDTIRSSLEESLPRAEVAPDSQNIMDPNQSEGHELTDVGALPAVKTTFVRREKKPVWNPGLKGLDPPLEVNQVALYNIVRREDGNRLCNNHYLRGSCGKSNSCSFEHRYRPNEAEKTALAFLARLNPCINGQDCDADDCVYGHHCPCTTDGVCTRRYCKFKPFEHPPGTRFMQTYQWLDEEET